MSKAILLFGLAAFALAGCQSGGDSTDTASNTPAPSTTGSSSNPATPPANEDKAGGTSEAAGGKFAAVQAVFNAQCVGCHGEKGRAGINLKTHETIMKGGEEGPIVVAGDPANSLLVKALRGAPGAKKMPPRGSLPEDQIKAVEDWIKGGAKSS